MNEDVSGDAAVGDIWGPAAPNARAESVVRPVKRRLAIVVLCVAAALWSVLFLASGSLQRGPSAKHLGGDFALFVSAATVLKNGGNPYDQRVLYLAERGVLRSNGLRPPAFDPYMRVGNPPLLFWALQPLSSLPFGTSAKWWCLAMYLLLALGFWGCLEALGWRRRLLPLAVFLAFPQTIYAAFYGNVDGLVFAALAWSTALMRKQPVLAGALLAVALLKPQVALPGAAVIVLFLAPAPLRVLAGFASASIVALALTIVTTGVQSLLWWARALTGYSDRIGLQPDIASLAGLYVYSAADRSRLILELLSLCLAAVLTLAWWWQVHSWRGVKVRAVAWLWIVWFLATPFAHFHDEVVLAIPMLAVVGNDGDLLGKWPGTVALFVLFFSILLFPTARAHTDFQSLTLLVVLACAVVQLVRSGAARSQGLHGGAASAAVVSRS